MAMGIVKFSVPLDTF